MRHVFLWAGIDYILYLSTRLSHKKRRRSWSSTIKDNQSEHSLTLDHAPAPGGCAFVAHITRPR